MIDPDDIPEQEPTEITAGNTSRWTRNLTNFPASAWTLAYKAFCSKGFFDVTATADGDEHSITITAAESQAFQAGEYMLVGTATKISGEGTYEVYRNALTVLANPAAIDNATDHRSHARKCLDAIEAVLERRASRADRSYQIAGRSIEHFSPTDLMDMRARYKQEVAAEEDALAVANGAASRRTIRTKFTQVL